MFTNIDNSFTTGLALALLSLIILMAISCLVPTILLEIAGVSRKFTNKFIGLFALLGFFLWIYLMFYLNLYTIFI
jgi:hypothetical protein